MADHTAIVNVVRHQRLLLDPFFVSAMALLTYDYLLTLHLEIEHIWFSKWTYTKVVFLIVRYMPFVFTSFLIYDQIAINASVSICKATFPAAVWMLLINLILCESILAIRTWAIWRRNHIVGIILGIVMTTFIVANSIFVAQLVKTISYGPPLYEGSRGCGMTGNIRRGLLYNYALISSSQAVVLALVSASAYRSFRMGNNRELSLVIHRDGILFYVYLLGISIAIVCVIATVPVELVTLLAPMEGVVYSVFVTRTILNIRAAINVGRVKVTELHTSYEFMELPLPLKFSDNRRFGTTS